MTTGPAATPQPPPGLCKAALQQAPYGIIVCRADGCIAFANELASTLLRHELIGHKLNTVIDIEERVLTAWRELLEGNRTSATMLFSLPPDQTHSRKARLSLQAQVLDGTFAGIEDHVLIFVDDLNNKRDLLLTDSLDELVAETGKELEAIQQQLIQSGKKTGMTETAGAIAHELRQPLTTVLGLIELLGVQESLSDDPQLKRSLETIQKQCLKMADIIKNMEQLVTYKTRPYVNGRNILDLNQSSRNNDPQK